MPNGPPFVALDTRSLPDAAQFEAWASALPAYEVSTRFPERGFSAQVRAWLLSPIVITHSILDPVRFRRTTAAAAADGQNSLTLQLFLTGRMRGCAGERVTIARAGEIALQDAARPFENTSTRTETVTVTLPRALLGEVLPNQDVHGLVLRGAPALLLATFLRQLPTALATMDVAAVARLPTIARDLLATAIVQATSSRPSPAATEPPVRERVSRFVGLHLNKRLSVSIIQNGVNASRASLYRAFAGKGGVMAFVLARRLDRVRRILNDRNDGRTIAEIAIATGFRSGAELGRAYRQRFGITPGTARRAASLSPQPTGPVQDQFRHWVEHEIDG